MRGALGKKLVDVMQLPQRAAHALVDVAPRRVHLRDPHRHPLAHAEVAAFEREQIAELEEAARPPRLDDPLAGERGRLGVRIDVAGEIEDAIARGGDARLDRDQRHVTGDT